MLRTTLSISQEEIGVRRASYVGAAPSPRLNLLRYMRNNRYTCSKCLVRDRP